SPRCVVHNAAPWGGGSSLPEQVQVLLGKAAGFPPPAGRLVLVSAPQLPPSDQRLAPEQPLRLDPFGPGLGAQRAVEHAAKEPPPDVTPALAARRGAVLVEQGQGADVVAADRVQTLVEQGGFVRPALALQHHDQPLQAEAHVGRVTQEVYEVSDLDALRVDL